MNKVFTDMLEDLIYRMECVGYEAKVNDSFDDDYDRNMSAAMLKSLKELADIYR